MTSKAVTGNRTPKNFFLRAFGERFVDGGVGTKLSHFVMGSGNFAHKQFAKGAIYLLIQVLFLLFMILCPIVNSTPMGYKALVNLGTLGTEVGGIESNADNSMLMLLFGVVTIIVMVMFVFTWLSNIKSSYKADLDKRHGKGASTFRQDCAALFDSRFHITMITPTIIGVSIFTIIPTLYMILIAFTTYGPENAQGQVFFDWVDSFFENFAAVFSGGQNEIAQRFLPVLGWTLLWAVLATVTTYFGGILLAMLINKKGIKGKTVFRTIFIMTIALPQFITLLSMQKLLATNGPINSMLVTMGIISAPMEFLAKADSAWTARLMIVLVNMWIGIPYTMLMTSGILMNIPQDLYEAAKVDGAKPVRIFRKITLPYIFFVTTPYLISSFIGNITSFNIIFMLTGGGPNTTAFKAGETDLLVSWLFKLTIENSYFNQGAVISIFTFLITSTVTLLTYRRTKAYKEEDTFQ